jgi:hypothetical protein
MACSCVSWQSDPAGEIFAASIDLTLSDSDICQPDLVYVPAYEETFTHPDFPDLRIKLDVLWGKGRF